MVLSQVPRVVKTYPYVSSWRFRWCSRSARRIQSFQRMQRSDAVSQDSRIKRGKDEDRFYCPYPGCTRSFAELWRLKVHYRAPPDVRGSGKERGHGTELQHCPKCGKELKPGKHHVGCYAGRSGQRQAVKRSRDSVRMPAAACCLATSPAPCMSRVAETGSRAENGSILMRLV